MPAAVPSRSGGRAAQTALQLLAGVTDATPEALRAVAGVLSHELRTPLTTIYSGSKLLSRHADRLSPPIIREVSTAIAEDAERLLRIVEDLVVAAALPGEPAISGEPVLLDRLLEVAARDARARWPHVQVRVDVAAQLPAVRGDEAYLEQVLRNVLDNAARYGPESGLVTVTAVPVHRRVEVRVSDEGPGIPTGLADEVFRLFAGPGTASRPGGLGLGLFVSRRLMERMGGTIRLDPMSDGGAAFVLDLAAYPVDER